jgi:uroporphyrinogen decarboxylase
MTSTERVLAAVDYEPTDRIPVWDNFWGDFPDNWRAYKGVGPEVDPHDYYGIDVEICIGDESFFPSQKATLRDEGECEIINDGWGRVVRAGKTDVYFYETLESAINELSDVDKIEFEHADLETRYQGFVESVNEMRAAGKCIFTKVGGLYIRSQFLTREDRLLMAMATDTDFCDVLFDKVAEHLTNMALQTLERSNTWETGLWVYDDMANRNTTMFSPAMFERYFLPRYKKLTETVRKAGCKHCFLHSDGNIRPVMDMLLEAGFEGFNPLEPRSGLDLVKLREKYGKRILFFGGVCNTQILPSGDKQAIEAHVRPLIEVAKDGGVVLGSASTGSDVPPEAYDYYMSLVRDGGIA